MIKRQLTNKQQTELSKLHREGNMAYPNREQVYEYYNLIFEDVDKIEEAYINPSYCDYNELDDIYVKVTFKDGTIKYFIMLGLEEVNLSDDEMKYVELSEWPEKTGVWPEEIVWNPEAEKFVFKDDE